MANFFGDIIIHVDENSHFYSLSFLHDMLRYTFSSTKLWCGLVACLDDVDDEEDQVNILIYDTRYSCVIKSLSGHIDRPLHIIQIGDKLVSGGWDYSIRIFDLKTGQCLATIQKEEVVLHLVALDHDTFCFCLSTDTQYAQVYVYSIMGQHLQTVQSTTGLIFYNCITHLHDGRIACGGSGSEIEIWDVHTGICIKQLQTDRSYFHALAEVRTNIIALASSPSIYIWDVEQDQCVKTLNGHWRTISALLRLQNGLLASESEDRSIRIWNVDSGACLHVFDTAIASHTIYEPIPGIVAIKIQDRIYFWCSLTGKLIFQREIPAEYAVLSVVM
jgi:WD40 repeat protein